MNEYDQNIEIMKDLKNRLDKVLKEQPESIINIQPKDTSKGHFYVSLAKSALRIVAGGALVATAAHPFYYDTLVIATGLLLIAAEVLGIVEEIV